MPQFDFEWKILGWNEKNEGGAIGTIETPLGDVVRIVLQRTLHSVWTWKDSVAEADRIARNEGDGTMGRYIRSGKKKGNLEVRLAPHWQRWEAGDYDKDQGFDLQPGLEPHIGDTLHLYGIETSELYVKGTHLDGRDYHNPLYPDLEKDFDNYPMTTLDILSSEIAPAELAQIWEQIPQPKQTINIS